MVVVLNQIERYLARTVLLHTLLVAVVVVVLIAVTTLLDEMGEVGTHHYTLLGAVRFTLLKLPAQGYQLFPMVMLVGTLLALGSLAHHSELTAMRAGGLTLRQLLWALVKSSFALLLLVALMGELWAPKWDQLARQARAVELGKVLHHTPKTGYWFRQRQEFVNVQRLLADGAIFGVDIFRFQPNGQLREAVHAQRGTFQAGEWRLKAVQISRFNADFSVESEQLEEWLWSSQLTPAVMGLVAVPPEQMALLELRDYIAYQQAHQLDAASYELSFWSRLVAPLSSLAMILLAVPFVLGSTRSGSTGLRVVQGILVGVVFYILTALSQQLGLLYRLPPLLSAVVPIGLVLAVGVVWLRRLVRH